MISILQTSVIGWRGRYFGYSEEYYSAFEERGRGILAHRGGGGSWKGRRCSRERTGGDGEHLWRTGFGFFRRHALSAYADFFGSHAAYGERAHSDDGESRHGESTHFKTILHV